MPTAGEALLAYEWQAWTPTLSNLTLGSGTVVARMRDWGKHVDYRFRFIYGSGSAVGTDPGFSLPFAPATDYISATFQMIPIGDGFILDIAAASRPALVVVLAGSTATIRYTNATPDVGQNITVSAPWTWAAGDTMAVSGSYEKA